MRINQGRLIAFPCSHFEGSCGTVESEALFPVAIGVIRVAVRCESGEIFLRDGSR